MLGISLQHDVVSLTLIQNNSNEYTNHQQMDDTNNTSPQNSGYSRRATEQSSSRQLPFNDTTPRVGERTCTQKLTIPSLEKFDTSSANLCSRKFVQYIKMTKEIDISTIVKSREILPHFRDRLETEIRDKFLWAIGQNSITEMTKMVREREPTSLPMYKL